VNWKRSVVAPGVEVHMRADMPKLDPAELRQLLGLLENRQVFKWNPDSLFLTMYQFLQHRQLSDLTNLIPQTPSFFVVVPTWAACLQG